MSDLIRAEHLRVDGEILVLANGVRTRLSDGATGPDGVAMDPRLVEAARFARLARELEERQERILGRAADEAAAVLEAAGRQAEALIADATVRARCDVDAILAEAREEAERLRSQAEAAGRAAGEESARAHMAGAIDDLRRRLEAIVAEARQTQDHVLQTAQPQAIALALAIARKVLEHELSDGGEALSRMICQALSRLRDKRDLRIRVSPGDLGHAAQVREQLLAMLDGVDGIEIVGDPRVDAGAIVETTMGTVNATLRGQLEEIEKAIVEITEREGEPA